jgi:hypothetical protein
MAFHAPAVGHRRMNRLFFLVVIVAVIAQGWDRLRQKGTFFRVMGIVTGEALPFRRRVVEVRFRQFIVAAETQLRNLVGEHQAFVVSEVLVAGLAIPLGNGGMG